MACCCGQGHSRPTRCGCGLSTGRPVSAVTIDFLAWGSAQLAAQGFTALLLIWDNASWHRSQAVRHWIRQHNQRVKRGAVGVRLVSCHLPSKSPWLNPIEPKWVHGKRAVSEADRLLGADELEARVYAYYGCQRETHLACDRLDLVHIRDPRQHLQHPILQQRRHALLLRTRRHLRNPRPLLNEPLDLRRRHQLLV